MSRKGLRILVPAVSLSFLVLFFQNCGPGFEVLKSDLSSSGISGGSDVVDLPPDVPIDPTGPLSVYVRSTQTAQGGDLIFNVELNKSTETPVVVELRTRAGTARADLDFRSRQSSVTIPAGQLRATFSVVAVGSSAAFADLSMFVEIVSASGAVIAQREAQGAIRATQKIENFVRVAVGENFSCGVTLQGTVKCWGLNYGRVPKEIVGLTGVKQIAAGISHACVILANDSVRCWGRNFWGQLGNGVALDAFSALPIDVVGSLGTLQISLGDQQSCGLFSGGLVRCWGYGYGLAPVELVELRGSKSMSSNGKCLIGPDDTVRCLGFPPPGPRQPGQFIAPVITNYGLAGAKKVSAGDNGSVYAITQQDTVRAAGSDQDIPGLSSVREVVLFRDGGGCAVTLQNTVRCFGSYPQRGGVNLGQVPPNGNVAVRDFVGLSNVASLSVGLNHACATTLENQVRCWGMDMLSQLGNSSVVAPSTPVSVVGVSAAKDFSGGENLSCAITPQDTVKCWGNNEGFSWSSPIDNLFEATPRDLPSFGAVKKVAVGFYYVCAITALNTVKCIGIGGSGQLGGVDSSTVAVDVAGPTGVTGLVANGFSTCALAGPRTIFCWGEDYGGLGAAPQRNDLTEDIVQIAFMNRGLCWLTAAGNVICGTPEPVMTGIKQIAGAVAYSIGHICGLTLQNTVKCWGANFLGQLGNNSRAQAIRPLPAVDVAGLSNIREISANWDHSCALTMAGGVKCWGSNAKGAIGQALGEDSLVPVDVPGVVGAQKVFVGRNSIKITRFDGSLSEIGDRFHLKATNFAAAVILTPQLVTSPRP